MTETCPTCHSAMFTRNQHNIRNNYCGNCGSKLPVNNKNAVWIPTNDGMFKYYRCSNCGHKEYYNKLTQCPSCKKEITTE